MARNEMWNMMEELIVDDIPIFKEKPNRYFLLRAVFFLPIS